MKIRKGERPALESLLEQEDADLDDMVEAVFATSVDLALQREWFMVAAWFPSMDTALYGPYESEATARRAVESMTSPGPTPGVYQIRRTYRIGVTPDAS